MSNAVNIFLFTVETLTEFMAKAVVVPRTGTNTEVFDTLKVDEAGEEADGSEIAAATGQLWGNGFDDYIKATYMPYFYKAHKVWRRVDGTARDLLGSNDLLGVGDICSVDGDTLYRCVSVDGATASTWTALVVSTVPGTIPVPSTASQPESIIANRAFDPPTIVVTSGCVNLQAETTTPRGITGTSTQFSGILSGRNNTIGADADFSVICGGVDNVIDDDVDCVIAGGDGNTIIDAGESCIGGGAGNTITPESGTIDSCTIAGGLLNIIREAHGTIGGGERNEIGRVGGAGGAVHATIGGGLSNDILRGDNATISGGETNVIGATAISDWSTIPGGEDNAIDGANYATAAGRRSKVTHLGAYLHSDATAQDEQSDRDNQHKIVAVGGFTERTTVGFGGGLGVPGEAVERFNGHASTTDAVQNDSVIGTLATDQNTMVFDLRVHSTRTDVAADNFKLEAITVFVRRTGGTVTVSFVAVAGPATGTGGTLVYNVAPSGDDIVLEITGNAVEDWEHTFSFSRQQGGLSA